MKKTIVAIFVMLTGLFTYSAWGALAEPVSPGGTGGHAVIAQACPTFSWSAAADAVAYRLEVYEMILDEMSHVQIRQEAASPVISKEISAPAFTWTPSIGECLDRGVRYIWYVQGINVSGESSWSEGRNFEVDLFAEAQVLDAMKETVENFFTNEWKSTDSYTQVKKEIKKEIERDSKVTAQRTIVTMSLEGLTNTLYGDGAGNTANSGPPDYNTFIGKNAGYKTQTGTLTWDGDNNSFIGYYAGFENTTGSSNTFMGYTAGYNNTTGSGNIFIGYSAGHENTAGNNNTFLGTNAGYNTTGSGNIFMGYRAGQSSTGSNKLFIDNSNTNSPLIYGEFDNNILKINGELYIASDERLKKSIEPLESTLEKVMLLKGVSYQWKSAKGENREPASNREVGLLAQNVESVLPELVHTDSQGYKAVAYDKMTAVLIEAIKEQQMMIKAQQAEFKQKEDHFEASLKEKNARIERLETEHALITETVAELSTRIAAVEGPVNAIASK